MEKQEEKKRKIQGTRTTSTQIVPLDVTSEILSKLPAKSVGRFRCVSKLWSSVTINPYFMKSFETQTQTRPSLLLFFKKKNNFFVFSISQHNQNPKESLTYSTSQPIDTYHTIYAKPLSFTCKAQSVNGLISFQNSTIPMIWNPTMRKFLRLPKPDKSWKRILVFLGYDPIEGKHKVLCFHNDARSKDGCRILTLGLDREWRSINHNHNHHRFGNPRRKICGRCIKGVLYYEAELAQPIVRVIMSFDVKAEKFDVIKIPPWGHKIAYMKMICYEGRLAYVDPSVKSYITIWVLEDAKKHEWSNRIFNLPLYKDVQDYTFTVIDITDDGELIYVTKTLGNNLDVIFVDPKRETFRRVTYQGVVDDDFRKRNGLGDKSLRVQFFPNHIETLMSL